MNKNTLDLLTLINSANFEHSHQVSHISELMARKAGLSSSECWLVTQAAIYHDVGKMIIPASILNKPSALTPAEFAIVKTHTDAGYKQIVDAIQTLTIAALIARDHHERQDGFGYAQMSGDEIHPYAKLVAVADVFDALYSRRAYKEPWSVERIKEHFEEQSGKQFDGQMVILLFSVLDKVLSLYENKGV